MKKIKAVVAFGIASLFLLGATMSPIASTTEKNVANEEVVGDTGKLKCYVFRPFQYMATSEVEINEEMIDDLQYIKESMERAKDELKDENINNAKKEIRNAIEVMKELDILPEEVSTEETLDMVFGDSNTVQPTGLFKFGFMQPILTVGLGISWIPLYPGEAFFGIMLRPMFFGYLAGFTASFNVHVIPPRIDYWDIVGPHFFMAFGFAGIYIDWAGIGICLLPFTQLAIGVTGTIVGLGC